MKKNIFAVCDLEADYASSFMNYLNKKKSIPFEIHAFSSVERLSVFARENRIELLLISGRAMRPDIKELDIGKIIILSEGNPLPELKDFPSVYKYQATSDVLREVMTRYGEESALSVQSFSFLKKSTEMIGVYSPVSRCHKTSLALTLGQLLARKKAVLYLNLESYAGFEELMGKEYAHTLSDLLYYIKQGDTNCVVRMNGMLQTLNGMDYIPPVHTPSDILSVTSEDLDVLLKEVALRSSYEVILIDIGSELQDLFSLLEKCDRIYMPVLSDPMSVCKIRQMEKLMREWDYAQVLSKIVKLELPEFILPGTVKNYAEQLPFGEFGEYVKELIL